MTSPNIESSDSSCSLSLRVTLPSSLPFVLLTLWIIHLCPRHRGWHYISSCSRLDSNLVAKTMSSKRKDIAREASHAGSWYTDSGEIFWYFWYFSGFFVFWTQFWRSLLSNVLIPCPGKELNDQLESWLRDAGTPIHGPARAIIAP